VAGVSGVVDGAGKCLLCFGSKREGDPEFSQRGRVKRVHPCVYELAPSLAPRTTRRATLNGGLVASSVRGGNPILVKVS
jgi:hypothetical protein